MIRGNQKREFSTSALLYRDKATTTTTREDTLTQYTENIHNNVIYKSYTMKLHQKNSAEYNSLSNENHMDSFLHDSISLRNGEYLNIDKSSMDSCKPSYHEVNKLIEDHYTLYDNNGLYSN